ncbi:HNH endonuclease [Priestia koreensis]|uniref:HNH endonuclease n=1 Tax=Priestia koreensis TaxID=284581 RepID=UPI0030184B13
MKKKHKIHIQKGHFVFVSSKAIPEETMNIVYRWLIHIPRNELVSRFGLSSNNKGIIIKRNTCDFILEYIKKGIDYPVKYSDIDYGHFIFENMKHYRNLSTGEFWTPDRSHISVGGYLSRKFAGQSLLQKLEYAKKHPLLSIRNNNVLRNQKIIVDKNAKVSDFQKLVKSKDYLDKKLKHMVQSVKKDDSNIERKVIDRESEYLNIEKKYKVKEFISTKEELPTTKVNRSISVVKRDSNPVNYLKQLYNNSCQICNKRIEISKDRYYSEVHHIRPLAKYNGPDSINNMIVLCPNHHVLFDMGSITIDLDNRSVTHINPKSEINNMKLILKHNIDYEFIKFYNDNIYLGNSKVNITSTDVIKDKVAKDLNNVSYGDTVHIIDNVTKEEFEIVIEDYHNRFFMTDIQKVLFNRKKGETINFNKFFYNIKGIFKKN